MGLTTKNAKVVAISLGSLQRLIALKAVPTSAVPLIVKTMGDAVSQGVDIQLRILQTLLGLVTGFPEVHGEELGDVSAFIIYHFHHPLFLFFSFGCFAKGIQALMHNAPTRPYYYASSYRNQESRWSRQQQQQRFASSSCS